MTITRLGGEDGFLKSLAAKDKEELLKLETLRELPKSRYATKLALTVYPRSRRLRKAVYSHVEVFKMAEVVAAALREAGVRPGTVCGVALRNSLEAVIYFFALEWIGAIVAPINVDLGVKEMLEICKKLNVVTLCTHWVDPEDQRTDELWRKTEYVVEQLKIVGWHLDRTINEGVVFKNHGRFASEGAAWAGGAGDFILDPNEIAVHILSKGGIVSLTHRAVAAAAKSFKTTYDLAVGMTTVLLPPLHDIHGILVLVATFYSGGHLVVPGSSDSAKLVSYVTAHRVSWMSASSDQVLEFYNATKGNPLPDDSQLNMIRVSGGKISADVLAKIEEQLRIPILESYGTPENVGFATTNREFEPRPGTVGKPVNGCQIAIFDPETREPLPPNSEGEIAIAGENLMTEYLGDQEATEMASYTTTARQEGVGARPETALWFATGDRGSIDNDGYLTLVGDSRSLRLAEIEAEEKARALEESRRKQEEAAAAAAAAASAAAAAEALREEERIRAEELAAEEQSRREAEEAEKARAEAEERDAKLAAVGVHNPHELDPEVANEILARLSAIEENQRVLNQELAERNKREMEDARTRLAEAELAAERAARGETQDPATVMTPPPVMMDIKMDEIEAAVTAAAASAQISANNTREAMLAAKEVAAAAYGAPNRSQTVKIQASTGDQGLLTKTVRVSLDDVESAMTTHPAVQIAKAFGRKDRRFGAEVFCAIVPKRGARVSEPWLKLHAQSVLPAPMVPKKFYYIEELPPGMSRKEIASSNILKDLSMFSGFSEVKHVRGPTWRRQQHKERSRRR